MELERGWTTCRRQRWSSLSVAVDADDFRASARDAAAGPRPWSTALVGPLVQLAGTRPGGVAATSGNVQPGVEANEVVRGGESQGVRDLLARVRGHGDGTEMARRWHVDGT
jgi:hypothetical protein